MEQVYLRLTQLWLQGTDVPRFIPAAFLETVGPNLLGIMQNFI